MRLIIELNTHPHNCDELKEIQFGDGAEIEAQENIKTEVPTDEEDGEEYQSTYSYVIYIPGEMGTDIRDILDLDCVTDVRTVS